MMTLLAGRVRNTSLPKSHALLPLHEAVVNALQSIESRYGEEAADKGRVNITVHRTGQQSLNTGGGASRTQSDPIVGFTVDDNGEGFTPENLRSFETFDSEHKRQMGCRGVGRLLWLKAFDRVVIRTTYVDSNGQQQPGEFVFSISDEVRMVMPPRGLSQPGASVYLDGLKDGYRSQAPKTPDSIAREVFEHCSWFFLRPGGAPDIALLDDGTTINLNSMLDGFVPDGPSYSQITVKGQQFDMASLRLRSARQTTPRLFWCAASRVVVDESLVGKVPGLSGRLQDDSGTEFTYVCYLSSTFLDTHVRADRTAFDISDRVAGDTLDGEPSLEDIRDAVATQIKELLSQPLAAAREAGLARVNEFVSNKAPRYRPVLARFDKLNLTVDPSLKDQELEILLHRQLQKLETEVIAEGQAVFAENLDSDTPDYQERVANYLAKVTDINQSDLAAYVARRRAILDLLSKLVRLQSDGKYSREDAIHTLLMPMRKDSNEIGPDAANLWIIDERLAFHDYLASDKTLKSMPITNSNSTKEPDILSTRLVGSPVLTAPGEQLPMASIVVIEVKRPMRNDASEDKNPIQQCLSYVERIRNGGVTTSSGRPIPKSETQPAFCYILADLTPTMEERCRYANLRSTADGLGYFGFNEPAKAYIEVFGFERLLNAAAERNQAFFAKLGLPTG